MTDASGEPGPPGWEALAIAALDVGILVLDASGVRHANQAAAQILGVRPEDLIGRLPGEARFAVFSEHGARVEPDAMGTVRALREQRPVEVRARLVHPDGREVWVSSSSHPFDLDGIPAVITALTDITVRKQAEDEARSGRRQLQQIVDAVDAAVFVKDREGRYVFVNSTFERELGLHRDQVLGRRTSDVASVPGSAAAAESQDERLLATGESVSDVLPFGDRTYLTTKSPLRDSDGHVYALVGVATNITAQMAAAEAAAVAAAVVESATDAIVTFDRELRVTGVNPVVAALDPTLAETAVGRHYLEAFPAGRREDDARRFLQAVLDGQQVETEYAPLDGPAQGRIFAVRMFPIRSTDGDVIGGTVMGRDVTDVRLAEADLLRLQRELEHVERLDSLGQLAGGIAHDFNNLLAAIKLTAETLVASVPRGSEAETHAERIVSVTDRATELIDRLLVFARKEAPSLRKVDVNDLVRHADALLERILGAHVERRLELTDRDCVVEADPVRLEQVVLNLALNARDAMPDGGVLHVRTDVVELGDDDRELMRTSKPGPHALLTVTDEGHGMDRETQRQAFEPFFTTKPRGEGTGLGLASVYAVTQQVGGGTWLYSEPGRGTVVKVALPLVARAVADGQRGGRPPAPADGAGRRVIVVDDEPVLREVAERLLTRAGFEVQSFPDSASLLAALPDLPEPHVLVTDVALPGLSGPEGAERVAARFPDVRVIYMSGYTAGLLGDRDLGEVLAKPFSSATLLDAVHRVLRPTD